MTAPATAAGGVEVTQADRDFADMLAKEGPSILRGIHRPHLAVLIAIYRLSALTPPLAMPGREEGWRTIDSYEGHGAVLAGAWNEHGCFVQGAAFLDVTGVWRVLHSAGGMTAMPFDPVCWRSLPAAPAADRALASSEQSS